MVFLFKRSIVSLRHGLIELEMKILGRISMPLVTQALAVGSAILSSGERYRLELYNVHDLFSGSSFMFHIINLIVCHVISFT